MVKEVEAASDGGLDFPACLASIIGKFNSAIEDGGGILPRPKGGGGTNELRDVEGEGGGHSDQCNYAAPERPSATMTEYHIRPPQGPPSPSITATITHVPPWGTTTTTSAASRLRHNQKSHPRAPNTPVTLTATMLCATSRHHDHHHIMPPQGTITTTMLCATSGHHDHHNIVPPRGTMTTTLCHLGAS